MPLLSVLCSLCWDSFPAYAGKKNLNGVKIAPTFSIFSIPYGKKKLWGSSQGGDNVCLSDCLGKEEDPEGRLLLLLRECFVTFSPSACTVRE